MDGFKIIALFDCNGFIIAYFYNKGLTTYLARGLIVTDLAKGLLAYY